MVCVLLVCSVFLFIFLIALSWFAFKRIVLSFCLRQGWSAVVSIILGHEGAQARQEGPSGLGRQNVARQEAALVVGSGRCCCCGCCSCCCCCFGGVCGGGSGVSLLLLLLLAVVVVLLSSYVATSPLPPPHATKHTQPLSTSLSLTRTLTTCARARPCHHTELERFRRRGRRWWNSGYEVQQVHPPRQ